MERDDKSLEEKKYIETATMAEIYIQAKKYQEGLEIYKRILEKDPSISKVAKKVEELEEKLSKIDKESG